MPRVAAVILAAGKGTRMKSDRAKVLHPVAGRPMLAHVLDAVAALAPARRVLVVGHQGASVREACAQTPGLEIVEQAEQRGTGHAVQVCEPALRDFDGTVLVLAGDVPLMREETLRAFLDAHHASGAPLSVLTTKPDDPAGYGRIVRQRESDRIEKIVEHRDAGEATRKIGEINSGVIAADAKFLFSALSEIRPDNSQKELYLTDVVGIAAKRGTPAVAWLHSPAWELEGVNDRAQQARAEAALYRRVATTLQAQGVTILDPATARIDPRARFASDVVIHPNVEIRGACILGAETVVETGCVIDECVLGAKVHVRPYCVLTRARASDGCIVGPFAHLRPEADLAEGVHVGNFVEVKKSTIGRGSKANHLAYIGDATIGSGVNVGAGTITCNYDGYEKHRTVIEDGVFIGSDTQLVAPVKVGKDAVIGAGTTVTKDVSPGALAITRPEQREIAGYAEKRRAKREGRNAAGRPPQAPSAEDGRSRRGFGGEAPKGKKKAGSK